MSGKGTGFDATYRLSSETNVAWNQVLRCNNNNISFIMIKGHLRLYTPTCFQHDLTERVHGKSFYSYLRTKVWLAFIANEHTPFLQDCCGQKYSIYLQLVSFFRICDATCSFCGCLMENYLICWNCLHWILLLNSYRYVLSFYESFYDVTRHVLDNIFRKSAVNLKNCKNVVEFAWFYVNLPDCRIIKSWRDCTTFL